MSPMGLGLEGMTLGGGIAGPSGIPNWINLSAATTSRVKAAFDAMLAGTRNMTLAASGSSVERGVDETANPYGSQYRLSIAEQIAIVFRGDGYAAGANNWYGISGTSLADYDSRDDRITTGGTAAMGSTVVQGGAGLSMSSATATMSFTPQGNVNTADIYTMQNAAFNGAQLQVLVDGSPAATITQNATNTIRKTTVALGAVGAHTITVNWAAGSNALYGIECYDNTRKEISVRNWGISGGSMSMMIDNTGTPFAGRINQMNMSPPDLVFGDIGVVNTWRAPAVSVATAKAQAEAYIDAIHAAGADFIFVVPPFDSSTGGNTANQQAYINAIVASCIAKGCAVFNLRGAPGWTSKAASDAAGFTVSNDAVHKTILGQANTAVLLRTGLTYAMFGGLNLTGGLNLSGTPAMDAVAGATWTATYGLGGLTSAWMSAGKNLFDIVGGITIKTVDGGYPNIKALAAALGVDPVTGSGSALVTKWYDQSGNGRDAAQTNNANRPWVGLVNGRLTLGFGGVMTKYIDHPAMADQWLDLPASVVMDTQSLSVFSLVKPYTTTSRTASSVTNYFGAGTLSTIISNSGFGLYAPSSFFAGAPGSLAHLYDLSNFENYGNDAPDIGIQNQVVYGILGPSGGKYGVNGVAQTGAAITAATPTGGRIGASVGGFGDSSFGGRMYAVLISSTIFNGAQETALKNALYKILNIPTAPPIANVLIDGASLDQGQGGVPGTLYLDEQNGGGYGWPEFVMDDLSNVAINWNNVAGSGFRIDQGTDFYTSIGNRMLLNPAVAKNILIGPNSQFGNSFSQGRTIAQVKTDFTAYMAAVKADPWLKVATIVFPETDDGSDPNGQEYTNWVIAGAAAGGYEVLQAPFNFFNDPTNLNGDHLSVLGYRRMATAFMPQIRQWLGL